jgi:hypothetical protein
MRTESTPLRDGLVATLGGCQDLEFIDSVRLEVLLRHQEGRFCLREVSVERGLQFSRWQCWVGHVDDDNVVAHEDLRKNPRGGHLPGATHLSHADFWAAMAD